MKTLLSITSAALCLAAGFTASSQAQQDPYIGQITAFGFGWCPLDWVPANGAELPIANFQTLAALYGTSFGGDGTTTFGVPDMRGRTPMGVGEGPPGAPPFTLGMKLGEESVTLAREHLADHGHPFQGSSSGPDTLSINYAGFATFPAAASAYADPVNQLSLPMHAQMLSPVGDSAPIDIRQPYLAVNFCVAYSGVYPQQP